MTPFGNGYSSLLYFSLAFVHSTTLSMAAEFLSIDYVVPHAFEDMQSF